MFHNTLVVGSKESDELHHAVASNWRNSYREDELVYRVFTTTVSIGSKEWEAVKRSAIQYCSRS